MPFGIPLDDLDAGSCYAIYIYGKFQPLTCYYVEMLLRPKEPARLVLKPVKAANPIQISVKDIESIQRF